MKEDDLKRLHSTLIEILDEVVRICNKYGLRYCLIGGTLIGAVRHKGFIPWDDDLDIVMPRPDYDKFCELCSNELDNTYYLHSLSTDPEYWLHFVKVRKSGTVFVAEETLKVTDKCGIFIDIFPQDYTNHPDSTLQKLRSKAVKGTMNIIRNRLKPDPLAGRTLRTFMTITRPLKIRTLVRFCNWVMTSGNHIKNPKYYVNYATRYSIRNEIMTIASYEPYKQLEFEGKLYNVPTDFDYNLKCVYGDYMQLPPEEKRVTHDLKELKF